MKFATASLLPFYLSLTTLVGAVPFSNEPSTSSAVSVTVHGGRPPATASPTFIRPHHIPPHSSLGVPVFSPTFIPPGAGTVSAIPCVTTIASSVPPSKGCHCVHPPISLSSGVPTVNGTIHPTISTVTTFPIQGGTASASTSLVPGWYPPHGHHPVFPPSGNGCVCATTTYIATSSKAPAIPSVITASTSGTHILIPSIITVTHNGSWTRQPSATPAIPSISTVLTCGTQILVPSIITVTQSNSRTQQPIATPAIPSVITASTSGTHVLVSSAITVPGAGSCTRRPSATPSQVNCPIVFTTTMVKYVTVYPSSVSSSVFATATPSTISFSDLGSSTVFTTVAPSSI